MSNKTDRPIEESQMSARSLLIKEQIDQSREHTIYLDLEIKYLESLLNNDEKAMSDYFEASKIKCADYAQSSAPDNPRDYIGYKLSLYRIQHAAALSRLTFFKNIRDSRIIQKELRNSDFPAKIEIQYGDN